jgi:hypothetical protein
VISPLARFCFSSRGFLPLGFWLLPRGCLFLLPVLAGRGRRHTHAHQHRQREKEERRGGQHAGARARKKKRNEGREEEVLGKRRAPDFSEVTCASAGRGVSLGSGPLSLRGLSLPCCACRCASVFLSVNSLARAVSRRVGSLAVFHSSTHHTQSRTAHQGKWVRATRGQSRV